MAICREANPKNTPHKTEPPNIPKPSKTQSHHPLVGFCPLPGQPLGDAPSHGDPLAPLGAPRRRQAQQRHEQQRLRGPARRDRRAQRQASGPLSAARSLGLSGRGWTGAAEVTGGDQRAVSGSPWGKSISIVILRNSLKQTMLEDVPPTVLQLPRTNITMFAIPTS